MTLVPLDNATWGFESDCFVCEPGNPAGLRIPFSHDVEAGVVSADFVLDDRFYAEVTDADGQRYVVAEAEFCPMGTVQARAAIVVVTGGDAELVQG